MSQSVSNYHFYKPFTKSSLGFLIQLNSSISAAISDEAFTLSNIDLYRQPLHNPIISYCILPFQVGIAIVGILIQARILQMCKYEANVNTPMMETQAKIHMAFWPLFILLETLVDNVYPVAELTHPLFCHTSRILLYICLYSFILYSFYAALLRYLFCIHTEKINDIGRERTIRVLHGLFYLHALIWSTLTIFTSGQLDHFPLINGCLGYDTAIFLVEDSTFSMLKRHFCGLDSAEDSTTVLRIGSCAVNSLMTVIFMLNIPEGYMYRQIYKWEMRHLEEREERFSKSLSTRSRQYRVSRTYLNVRIHFLAYMTEVLGSIVLTSLSLIRSATPLYMGFLLWYHVITPSCYLVNSSDIKELILEDGWRVALSKIYSKKKDDTTNYVKKQRTNESSNPPDQQNIISPRIPQPEANETPEAEEKRKISRVSRMKQKIGLNSRRQLRVGPI